MAKKQPRVRYYTRFKGDFGYLRAVIWYDKQRKFILTPMVIDREQLSRFDTAGRISPVTNISDARLCDRLRDYTAAVMQVVTPLVESGEYTDTPSSEIAASVAEAVKGIEAAREARAKAFYRESLKREGYDVDAMPPEAFEPGWHNEDGSLMTKTEAKAYISQINEAVKAGRAVWTSPTPERMEEIKRNAAEQLKEWAKKGDTDAAEVLKNGKEEGE